MGYDAMGNYDGIPDDAGALTAPAQTNPNAPGAVNIGSTPSSNNSSSTTGGSLTTGEPGYSGASGQILSDSIKNPQASSSPQSNPSMNTSAYPNAGANPLDKYASFNCLFTLACLSKNQQNSGNISISSLKNVIISSKGDWANGNRANTVFGQFDYFMDDLIIQSRPIPSGDAGMSTALKITFKVTEPYSMGLFMVALNEGSAASGYPNFREAAYVIAIEFAGYDQSGKPSTDPALTRYIPIQLLNIKFKVTQAGSVYECEARPYNHLALSDQQSQVTKDVTIRGSQVSELLTGTNDSLTSHLKRSFEELVAKHIVPSYDKIEIHFPKDFQDVNNSGNDIGNSILFKTLDDNGSVPFPNNNDIFDQAKQIYKNSQLKISPNKSMTFSQNLKIEDIITEVVLRSDYIVKQLLNQTILTDKRGMIHWFKIETRVMDLDDNPALGRQNRKMIYRVVPYDVHVDKFLPPNTKPPGYDELKKTVSRVYNYIYTGLNTEIISVDLEFNAARRASLPADATGRSATNISNQGSITAGGSEPKPKVAPEAEKGDTKGDELVSVSLGAQRDVQTKVGGTGSDDINAKKVQTMNALLTNGAEMLELKLTIMGDPYYLPSSGMGNIVVPKVSDTKLKDGSMNVQGGEIDFVINFRTPVDLNPSTGLYDFDAVVDMWSGLYMIMEVESKFNHNKFTQTITGRRRHQQVSGSGTPTSILGNQ